MTSVVINRSNQYKGIKGWISSIADFCKDLHEAYQYSNFSFLSAYYEIKSRYASSYLGPMWIVLSNVIFIGFISLLYSSIFNMALDDYIPYLTAGYLLWTFMVAIFLEGSGTFVIYGQTLKDYKISPLVLYCRMFYRNVIIFAHNLPIIFAVVLYFKGFVIDVPMFLFGMMFNLVCIFLIGIAISIVSCRFRDIYYVMPSIFQVLILMMPILWKPEMLVGRKILLVEVNFIYQLLEIVRSPLLGQVAPAHFYLNSLVLLAFLFVMTAVMYERSKSKIVFWT